MNKYKYFKMFLSLTLSLFCAGFSNLVYASQSSIEPDMNAMHLVNEIDQDLHQANSSIEQELSAMVELYLDAATSEENPEKKDKLLALADAAENLSIKYADASDNTYPRASSGVEARHALQIAAIVSWFQLNDYFLAAELLLVADENTSEDTRYMPVNDTMIHNSSVIRDIRDDVQSGILSSSGSFPASQSLDLYYAIHLFDWDVIGKYIVITDKYDYELGDPSYSDLAGQAVNAMALAQIDGAIVPYEVVVHTYK